MPLSERTAGTRFQILLESDGAMFVIKCGVGPQAPRPVFRRVGNFAGVVLGQPGTQIISYPDVKMLRVQIFENVDVFHGVPSLEERIQQRGGLPKPVFALRATTRQPSLTSLRETSGPA
jgi:hypothetical protein